MTEMDGGNKSAACKKLFSRLVRSQVALDRGGGFCPREDGRKSDRYSRGGAEGIRGGTEWLRCYGNGDGLAIRAALIGFVSPRGFAECR